MLKNAQPIKTAKFTVIAKKMTIETTTDPTTAIHKGFKFIQCTTHPRRNRYLKSRTISYPNTKTKHSQTRE